MTANEGELVECRICSRRFRSVGGHVRHAHDMSADAYRDRFGIRRSQPLTCDDSHSKRSASMRRTISDGRLDAHFAGNAERGRRAGVAGVSTKRQMAAGGIAFPTGTETTPRDRIAALVLLVEGGARVATAVRRSGIAYSAYHAGLARHPDLKARHDAAMIGRLGPRSKRRLSQD